MKQGKNPQDTMKAPNMDSSDALLLFTCCDDLLEMYKMNFLSILHALTGAASTSNNKSCQGTLEFHNKTSCTMDKSVKRRTSTLRNQRSLPPHVHNKEIYVDVEMAGVPPKDLHHYNLITKTKTIVEQELKKEYSASMAQARYILKIFVFMVSDGSVCGTSLPTEKTAWGKAAVGLAWRLFEIEFGSRQMKLCDGGVLVLTQKLTAAEILNVFKNYGERFVLEKLAPMCARDIVQELERGARSRGPLDHEDDVEKQDNQAIEQLYFL